MTSLEDQKSTNQGADSKQETATATTDPNPDPRIGKYAPCVFPREFLLIDDKGEEKWTETNEHEEEVCRACGWLVDVHDWGISGKEALERMLDRAKTIFGGSFVDGRYEVVKRIKVHGQEHVVFKAMN